MVRTHFLIAHQGLLQHARPPLCQFVLKVELRGLQAPAAPAAVHPEVLVLQNAREETEAVVLAVRAEAQQGR